MNLQEACLRSQAERVEYPEIFDINSGLYAIEEFDVIGIPSWNRNNPQAKRKVILEITTFKGISSDAIHYYGKLIIDGVYQATLSNPEKPRNLSSEENKNNPLLNYKYELVIKRPLTLNEIKSDTDRWYCYDEGDLVEGYEQIEDLINDVKEIISLRFKGDWDFYVQYPRGDKHKLTI